MGATIGIVTDTLALDGNKIVGKELIETSILNGTDTKIGLSSGRWTGLIPRPILNLDRSLYPSIDEDSINHFCFYWTSLFS